MVLKKLTEKSGVSVEVDEQSYERSWSTRTFHIYCSSPTRFCKWKSFSFPKSVIIPESVARKWFSGFKQAGCHAAISVFPNSSDIAWAFEGGGGVGFLGAWKRGKSRTAAPLVKCLRSRPSTRDVSLAFERNYGLLLTGGGRRVLALVAKPEDLEDVSTYLKTIFGFDSVFQVGDQALVQMHAASAFVANEVMVMLTGFYHFIPPLSITEIDSLYQS